MVAVAQHLRNSAATAAKRDAGAKKRISFGVFKSDVASKAEVRTSSIALIPIFTFICIDFTFQRKENQVKMLNILSFSTDFNAFQRNYSLFLHFAWPHPSTFGIGSTQPGGPSPSPPPAAGSTCSSPCGWGSGRRNSSRGVRGLEQEHLL